MNGRVIIINNEYCGESESLGNALIGVFLRKILASLDKPEIIIFYNSGVRILTSKSENLPILEALQTAGVDIVACGMCISGVCDSRSLLVGRVTSMDEIVSILMKAQKVITL